jgi:hypothetical protein
LPNPAKRRIQGERIVVFHCGGKEEFGLPLTKPTVSRRGNTMIKKGDMLQNIQSGEVFRVRSVDPRVIILGTKDGSRSMFVNPGNVESAFLPFVEDEAKTKPNE